MSKPNQIVRIKDILTVETRVSIYQTCINNSKGRTSKIIMKNAKEMYAIFLEDIQEFGGIEVNKINEFVEKSLPKRKTPKRKVDAILKKVTKNKFKKGKKK